MSDQRTGSGWQPLSKPDSSRSGRGRGRSPQPVAAQPSTPGERLNLAGLGVVTPFVRLARTHAMHAAGDAIVVVALAGSLFSLDFDAARSRILLYLVLTMAPFAVVGPLIGPALDRIRGGHRLVIMMTLLVRAVLMVLMIPNIDNFWFFPIAFVWLVMGKTYSVAKAATVPSTVTSSEQLVDKNSRLAILSAVAGGIGAAPASALQAIFGSSVTLGYAFLVYCTGVVASFRMPRVTVDDPTTDADDFVHIRSAGVRLAASAMTIVRGVVGFWFFLLVFAFGRTDQLDLSGLGTAAGAAVKFALGFDLVEGPSQPRWKVAIPFAFWGLGIFVGNLIAPRIRQRITEERMILGALAAVVAAGIAALWAGGLSGAALLALIVGAAPSGAKLAFDSLVQRDAPGANHGAVFGRFETRFQIAWVIGALFSVMITVPLRVGFAVVTLAAAFAGVTYQVGSRAVRHGYTVPTGAGPSVWKRMASRTRRRGTGPEPQADGPPSTGEPPTASPGTDAPAPAAPRTGAPLPAAPTPVHHGADPYAQAFADAPIEPPDWAAAVFGDEPQPDPLAPPEWLHQGGHQVGPVDEQNHSDPDPTPPMGTPIDPNL